MSRVLTLFCACVALVSSAVLAAENLPDFLNKVQLSNVGGAEATADGTGVKLCRVPKAVRDQLTDINKNSKKTSKDAP